MLANIVEKWCLRGWYKNQKIPDLCGGAEQLQKMMPLTNGFFIDKKSANTIPLGCRQHLHEHLFIPATSGAARDSNEFRNLVTWHIAA
ncbi:hypothetical protein [Endozoicomonas sp. SCSIO W0465]|uniref:hypothetical protein n=1 Tax=Endozoicomonas sp. SCSIO W0465 TaxID=2918516 RepID=UPI0020763962|nr:hypothetical protein [Endozoicomonas sp. SCSIO W0465]USE35193.1 hypothetical protein MJO57_24285 [Endozoicomonas sp. SCSIO W0465]